ncbi:hypothetical protein BD413DRAFT_550623 [Trametes elegans]|nr:hypothetical protein BD413DRAFT_550623 [Trametes elegans]
MRRHQCTIVLFRTPTSLQSSPLNMSNPVSGIPPWPLATRTDGSLDFLGIPEWLQEHPELKRRGLVLDYTLKPFYVFVTNFRDATIPASVVKVLLPDSQEAAIYKRLAKDPEGFKHLIPFELVETDTPALLIMPYLMEISDASARAPTLSALIGVLLQLVEAVDYLHNHHIAHLDIMLGNVLVGQPGAAALDNRVVEDRIYLIDFHTSRQFDSGPGVETAIPLPCTQESLPLGMKEFDPYSWDVYCVGQTWQRMVDGLFYGELQPPRTAKWIERWITGKERGCTTTCHCRPTIRRVRQVLTVVHALVWVVERCVKVFNPALIALRPRHSDRAESGCTIDGNTL